MRQGRDAEPGLLPEELLQPVEGAHAQAWLDGVAAQGARDLAQAVGQQPGQRVRIAPAGEGVAAHPVAAVLREQEPEGVELRDLLLQGHPRQQVAGALRGGEGGVLVRCRHGAHSEAR